MSWLYGLKASSWYIYFKKWFDLQNRNCIKILMLGEAQLVNVCWNGGIVKGTTNRK